MNERVTARWKAEGKMTVARQKNTNTVMKTDTKRKATGKSRTSHPTITDPKKESGIKKKVKGVVGKKRNAETGSGALETRIPCVEMLNLPMRCLTCWSCTL